jgi:hypothetical protein
LGTIQALLSDRSDEALASQREEEDEWTRFGRVRGRLEQTEAVEAPRQPQRVKQAVRSKKP